MNQIDPKDVEAYWKQPEVQEKVKALREEMAGLIAAEKQRQQAVIQKTLEAGDPNGEVIPFRVGEMTGIETSLPDGYTVSTETRFIPPAPRQPRPERKPLRFKRPKIARVGRR